MPSSTKVYTFIGAFLMTSVAAFLIYELTLPKYDGSGLRLTSSDTFASAIRKVHSPEFTKQTLDSRLAAVPKLLYVCSDRYGSEKLAIEIQLLAASRSDKAAPLFRECLKKTRNFPSTNSWLMAGLVWIEEDHAFDVLQKMSCLDGPHGIYARYHLQRLCLEPIVTPAIDIHTFDERQIIDAIALAKKRSPTWNGRMWQLIQEEFPELYAQREARGDDAVLADLFRKARMPFKKNYLLREPIYLERKHLLAMRACDIISEKYFMYDEKCCNSSAAGFPYGYPDRCFGWLLPPREGGPDEYELLWNLIHCSKKAGPSIE